MAIAFDAQSSDSGNGATLSWSHTCSGTDRVLVVSVGYLGDASKLVSGITYNGVALTNVRADEIEDKAQSQIWYLENPDAGTYDIEVTFSSAVEAVGAGVSLTGAASPTFRDGGAVGGQTDNPQLEIHGSGSGFRIGLVAVDGNVTATLGGSGWTESWNILSAALRCAGAYKADTSNDALWTLGSADDWSGSIVEVS